MKIGSIVYATEQGLGYLAKAFYDHGIITDVLVVEHSSRRTMDWYPGATRVPIRAIGNSDTARSFCRSMDTMLFFETPFDWSLIDHCAYVGIRTAMMPMYECMPKNHPQTDIVINPSLLDQKYYPRGTFIPVPVKVPWRQREFAHTFVHNAGHGGLRGRNGTEELLEAMQYIQSPLHLIIRSQYLNPRIRNGYKLGPKMTVDFQGSVPYEDLWKEGDVFMFPEKFNGLSLPLQEAYASGMLVMATDRFPINNWLPKPPLITPSGYKTASVSSRCVEFQEAIVSPRDIAGTMDLWFGKDISLFSVAGLQWASHNSWDVLGPVYKEVLCAS